MMPSMRHVRRQRPAWWPENEPWPPRRFRHRNPFSRRIGCLFVIFNLLGILFFVALVGLGAHALGLVHLPLGGFDWMLPLGIGVFLLAVGLIVWGASRVRRMSVPLDDLLGAAGRLAQGDYAARVAEKGPPEVRALARAFNSMAVRLQLTNDQRRNLLADVTHELRTPLTVIQGNVEGMLDGVYPADETRLKSILEEARLLSRLIEDLRTLSLAESGALQLKKEPTDLGGLIRDTAAAFRSQFDMAGVQLDTALERSPVLNIDPGRVREVLSNLIANALRYTPRGGRIRIACDPVGSGQAGRASISIADSGAGISPEDLPNIFNRFYKTSDSGGMGLGLSIAKYIVEAHGGLIKAESQIGKGTTITFTFPLDSIDMPE